MKTKIPPGLDDVANEWRQYLSEIEVHMTYDTTQEVKGMSSVYVLTFDFEQDDYVSSTWFYVGLTENMARRGSEHKSEFKNCKTTTRIGKSKLYTPAIMNGITAVRMHMRAAHGGLEKQEAKLVESNLATWLKSVHGEEFVLTNPSKLTKPVSQSA